MNPKVLFAPVRGAILKVEMALKLRLLDTDHSVRGHPIRSTHALVIPSVNMRPVHFGIWKP